jgi:Protein of unknown function (DUF1488)
VLNDTADLYRYFDATEAAEFLYACVLRTVEEDLPREIDYLRRHDQALRRIMNTVEMPDRLAENLLMFMRQNKGTLSKRRRTGEFKRLTYAEVSSLEAVVNEAFEGLNAQDTSASEIHDGVESEPVRELQFPNPREAFILNRQTVVFWGQDGETRVYCAISREALHDHFKGDNKDKLEVFIEPQQTRQVEAQVFRNPHLPALDGEGEETL